MKNSKKLIMLLVMALLFTGIYIKKINAILIYTIGTVSPMTIYPPRIIMYIN